MRGKRCFSTAVGSAKLDWAKLGFDYRPTAGFVKYTFNNGRWDEGVLEEEPYLKLHVMSSAIHYGQAVYEGAKAHHCADGKVRLWNIASNAQRMVQGCERMMMPVVPPEMFIDACERAVRANLAFVPPHGSGGSMYLRPYIFGHGPQLGLAPAPTFSFCVLATPVSSYYGERGLQPIDALVVSESDRAAPLGVGNVKASGNYGGDIQVTMDARGQGYPTVLYLDAKEHKYVEEFSVSNFIGIKRGRSGGVTTYVTPDSNSVLRSTTNDMLMEIAQNELGMKVERRPIAIDELKEFDEVAGCGTAVVMMGVQSLTMQSDGMRHTYDASLPTIGKLYDTYRAIQFGERDDAAGWGTVVDTSSCAATGIVTSNPNPVAPRRAAAAAEAGVSGTKPVLGAGGRKRSADFDKAADAAIDVEADLAAIASTMEPNADLHLATLRAANAKQIASARSLSTLARLSTAAQVQQNQTPELLRRRTGTGTGTGMGGSGGTSATSARRWFSSGPAQLTPSENAAAATKRLARSASVREDEMGADFQMDPTLAYRSDRTRMSPLASLRMAGTEPNVFSKFQTLAQEHNAVNLASGYPNYPIPEFVKNAGVRGIMEDHNQYTRPAGHPELVKAVQEVYEPRFERFLDSETEIAVVGGATNAIFSAVMALVDPGDEVVCVEPYFDAPKIAADLMGAKTIGVPLRTDWASSSGDWTLDLEELDAAMSEKTKMLVLNTPHNPTGKVFTRDELKGISDVVMRYPNVTVLSDEVYEFMTFDGLKHERIATLPGMWERTLSVYSAGKTFSATGWRVGYVVGPQPLITPLVRVHQASNFCTPSALQIAIAIALREAEKENYWETLSTFLERKRDRLCKLLRLANLVPIVPQGGYFVLTDTSRILVSTDYETWEPPQDLALEEHRDFKVCQLLTERAGVSAIPTSAFYGQEHRHITDCLARFCFAKTDETLDKAYRRIIYSGLSQMPV